MSAAPKTLDARSRTITEEVWDVTITAAETFQLIEICVEPIDLWGKLTWGVDQAVRPMV